LAHAFPAQYIGSSSSSNSLIILGKNEISEFDFF